MIDIRTQSAKLLQERYSIPEMITELLFEDEITDEQKMKKILIKEEYRQKVEPGTKQILKSRLAQKYCVSMRVVERFVK